LPQTLDDLAALSGVSRATVSRVINGRPVSPATRLRVVEALEATGYRPNVAARSLASGRSGVIGTVLHIDPHLLFQDSYFAQLLQGVSDFLAERSVGMMLWLGSRTNAETLDHVLGMSFLDGVIVSASRLQDPIVDGLLASDLPTVLIGHRRDDLTASYVDIDNESAADTITTHLISLGRMRVGHITGSRGTVAGEDRVTGYQLDRGVDAIFCGNDATAEGALETIRARGLRVPDDVALAGFDDLDFASRMDPPLTTVRQGVRQQGMEAGRALLQLVADTTRSPRRVLLPTELVIRQSTVGGVPRG
jgi:DNA-binding LacI/PurR family transcriptional regulator